MFSQSILNVRRRPIVNFPITMRSSALLNVNDDDL